MDRPVRSGAAAFEWNGVEWNGEAGMSENGTVCNMMWCVISVIQ